MEHGRAAGMVPQLSSLIAHFGAHHEHAQPQILLTLRHIDVHGNPIRLTNHEQLLLSRQQDVRLRERTWTDDVFTRPEIAEHKEVIR